MIYLLFLLSLFYGIVAGLSLFVSQLFVPILSLLTINVFAVVISFYFVIKKVLEDKDITVNSKVAGFYVIVVVYTILVLGAFIGKPTQIIMLLSTMLLCCQLVTKLKKEKKRKKLRKARPTSRPASTTASSL